MWRFAECTALDTACETLIAQVGYKRIPPGHVCEEVVSALWISSCVYRNFTYI